MRVLLFILVMMFATGEEDTCWLVQFDPIENGWFAVPVDDLSAEPVAMDFPPYALSWSETGIAYVDDAGNLIIQIDDESTVLVEDGEVWGKAWSHDGRFFAYAYTLDEVHQLAVYDVESGEIIPLVEPLSMWSAYIGLRWSPDDMVLAALLAEPPMPEAAYMIDAQCLTDSDAECDSTRLYDPAEDDATGESLPIWQDDSIVYACSGQLCILDEDGLTEADIDDVTGRLLSVDIVSPCGDYALIRMPQTYQMIDMDGEIVAEYPLEAIPFFWKGN